MTGMCDGLTRASTVSFTIVSTYKTSVRAFKQTVFLSGEGESGRERARGRERVGEREGGVSGDNSAAGVSLLACCLVPTFHQ